MTSERLFGYCFAVGLVAFAAIAFGVGSAWVYTSWADALDRSCLVSR